MPGQRHIVLLYFAVLLLWGLSVDHPAAPLRDLAFLRWISAPLIVGLLATMIARKLCGPLNVYGLNLPFVLLLAWAGLSTLVNGGSGIALVAWVLLYLKFVLFSIYLDNLPLHVGTAHRLMRAVTLFGCFLVAEGYVRWAVGAFNHPDRLSLVLGPHGTVAVGMVCTISIAYLGASALVHRKPWLLLVCVGLVSVSVPGEIKGLLLGGPLAVGAVFFAYAWGMRIRFASAKLFVAGSLAVILIVGLAWTYENHLAPGMSQNLPSFFENIGIWISEGGSLADARINRVSSVARALLQLAQVPRTFLFGQGPGSSFAEARSAPLVEFDGQTWNQLGATLIDIGMVGLLLFLMMLLRVALPCWRMVSRLAELQPDQRVLVLTFCGVSVQYIVLAPMYDLAWRYDAAGYVFFLLSSALYAVRRLHAVEPGPARSVAPSWSAPEAHRMPGAAAR